LISPFIERRRENGWGLYGLLNIQKGEKAKIAQQQPRNDQFFDAPVGLFFAVNQALNICAKMDIAMMRNVMTSVKAQGSDSCHEPYGITFMLSMYKMLNSSAAWHWVMRILSRSSIAL